MTNVAIWKALTGAALILTAVPANTADKPLSPFKFTNTETYMRQLTEPVCQDFRDYLNFPRSNDLFKPDGTLVRETKKFKSVHWETLDKAKYREQFMLIDDGPGYDPDPIIRKRSAVFKKSRSDFYDDPDQILQRTRIEILMSDKAPYMQDRIRVDQQKHIDRQRWLYRVVSKHPKHRDFRDINSPLELPRGFPNHSIAWLGNVYGTPYPLDGGKRSLGGGSSQWFVYTPTGYTYAVGNGTYAEDRKMLPRFLRVGLSVVDAFDDKPIAHGICSYRARNEQ